MTEAELAWAAGFFDGEGTVRISKPMPRNTGALLVSMANTDYQTVEWFQQRWPGYVKPYKPVLRKRQAWRWQIGATKAAAFLVAIRPFVVRDAMREKIDYALAFQAQKRAGVSSDEYCEQQWIAYWWMGKLNQRGVREVEA